MNKDQSDRIKAVSSATIGLEIISQEKNKLELLDLSSADEESLLKAEKQIFWRLLHMLDTILDKKTTDLEIKLIDYEINKLTFFIQRNLATKFSSNPKNFLLYEKVSVLESLGDSLRSLKIYSRDIDEKFIKKIYNILDLLKSDNLENNNLIAIKSEMFHLRKLSEQKQNKKENDSLAYILIYKNLKQIFDITFTINIRKIIA